MSPIAPASPGPRLLVEPRHEPVGGQASLGDLLRRFRGRDRLVAFDGRWAGGGSIVTFQPIREAIGTTEPQALTDLDVLAGTPPPGFVGGGYLGYLGYGAFSDVPVRGAAPDSAVMGYYPWLLRRLPGTRRWTLEWLWCPEYDAYLGEVLPLVRSLVAAPAPVPSRPYRLFDLRGPDAAAHLLAIERTKLAIRRGDVFQANVCTRVHGQFDGDPLDLYVDGAEQMAPDWSALVTRGTQAVVSFSPELFLDRDGVRVATAPIKGTSPRTGDPDHDARSYEALRGSAKDHAENTMIVDLMRNDVGVLAEPGSVTVADLHRIEPHANVWHLVSTVEARVPLSVPTADILRAAWPPGSVTGAPKTEALEVIRRVEAEPRGAYTGAAGYLSVTGRCEFNVLIRTFERSGPAISIGTGGGITEASDPVAEWRECVTKVKPLVDRLGGVWAVLPVEIPVDAEGPVFDTALAVDGVVVDAEAHERRTPGAQVPRRLTEHGALDLVRVTVAADRQVSIERQPFGPTAALRSDPVVLEPVVVGRYRRPVKWVDRTLLERIEAETDGPVGDVLPLLVDPAGRLIETTRTGLLVVEPSGRVVVPASLGTALESVTAQRTALLAAESGLDTDVAVVSLSDLTGAHTLLVASALSGVRLVERVGELRFTSDTRAGRIASGLAHAYRRFALGAPATAAASTRLLADPQARYRWHPQAHGQRPARMPRVLLVDNRDSFVHNLRHRLEVAGAEVVIVSAHGSAPHGLTEFDALVISPGPLAPSRSGLSLPMIDRFAGDRPVLGVCLGHQCIGAYFGARVVAAPTPRHGTTSVIVHDGAGVLAGLAQGFPAARYHSLCLDPADVPAALEVCAMSDDGVVMAVRSRHGDLTGVQFHPESVLTPDGQSLVGNFVDRAARHAAGRG